MFLTANENEDNGGGKKSQPVLKSFFEEYREETGVSPEPRNPGETSFAAHKTWKENFPNLN